MRAPCAGEPASVTAIRSAISCVVAMPFASSSARTATSSRSPSVSSSALMARAPASVRRPRPAPCPRPPVRPQRVAREGARDRAAPRGRAGEGKVLGVGERAELADHGARSCRAGNAACGYARGRASPASRRARAPASRRESRTPPLMAAQRGLQLRLGDDALAQQVVGQRADPAPVIAEPVVRLFGDRLDPAPQLVDRDHAPSCRAPGAARPLPCRTRSARGARCRPVRTGTW